MTLDLTSILEKKSRDFEKKGYDHLSIIERAAKLEKKLEEEEEVLERGKNYKIGRIKGEKLPTYVVFISDLTQEDRELLKKIERRAIGEITLDPESIPAEKRKKAFTKEVVFHSFLLRYDFVLGEGVLCIYSEPYTPLLRNYVAF